MIVLPYLSVIQTTGVDAGAFLHAQLAADISALAIGQSCFASYCNPQGQVLALLLVCRREHDFLLICEAGLANTVIQRLGIYVLRSQVNFQILTEFQVAGAVATDPVVAETTVFKPVHVSMQYCLVAASGNVEDQSGPWRRNELLEGVVWLQAAVSARFLPQMLGLERIGAVSFSKGCYPGQEIIARTRYLGKLKRQPVLVEINDSPPLSPGEVVSLRNPDSAVDGTVIEVTGGGTDKNVVLCVAPLEAAQPVDSISAADRSWPAQRIPFSRSTGEA